MASIKQFRELIDLWNVGDIDARNKIIELIQPIVERFARQEFARGKVVNTPMLLFTGADVYQEVAVRLMERQSKITFDSVEHLLRFINQMAFSIIVDTARKVIDPKPWLAERVNTSEVAEELADDDIGEEFFHLMRGVESLEKLHRKQAMAFAFHNFWGLEMDEICEVLGVGERQVRRYIEFAGVFLMKHVKDSND